MKTSDVVPILSDHKNRSWICSLLVIVSLICAAYFFGNAFVKEEYKHKFRWEVVNNMQKKDMTACKDRCRPSGIEPLPKGIVAGTSNLQLQPLWGSMKDYSKPEAEKSLLALAVGIKQKEIVDKIVKKFPWTSFIVMLFHYDGLVDDWKSFEWSKHAIHVSAVNQTKWWFAKRFLHPNIVFEYEYIFLWDEDLGVENFDPIRYLSIVKDEGLEISQPALDPVKSDVHHPITSRLKTSRVHRRMYKFKGSGRCDSHSTSPPCIGWVEMMAPVFSKAAWQCVWHLIQNDLIHAWGLDQLLGYCAQGDRTKNVGVVDAEYIVHLGLPTLGVTNHKQNHTTANSKGKASSGSVRMASSGSRVVFDNRMKVRQRSGVEMKIFRKRWQDAVEEDQCWVDPYQTASSNRTIH